MVKIGDTITLTKLGATRVLDGQVGQRWTVRAIIGNANADLSTRVLDGSHTILIRDDRRSSDGQVWSLTPWDYEVAEEAWFDTPARVVLSVSHDLDDCPQCRQAIITAGAHMGINGGGARPSQATIDQRGIGGPEHTAVVQGGGFADDGWIAGFDLVPVDDNTRLELRIVDGARSKVRCPYCRKPLGRKVRGGKTVTVRRCDGCEWKKS